MIPDTKFFPQHRITFSQTVSSKNCCNLCSNEMDSEHAFACPQLTTFIKGLIQRDIKQFYTRGIFEQQMDAILQAAHNHMIFLVNNYFQTYDRNILQKKKQNEMISFIQKLNQACNFLILKNQKKRYQHMNGFVFGAGKLIAGKIKIGGIVPYNANNELIERQPILKKKFLGITLDKK